MWTDLVVREIDSDFGWFPERRECSRIGSIVAWQSRIRASTQPLSIEFVSSITVILNQCGSDFCSYFREICGREEFRDRESFPCLTIIVPSIDSRRSMCSSCELVDIHLHAHDRACGDDSVAHIEHVSIWVDLPSTKSRHILLCIVTKFLGKRVSLPSDHGIEARDSCRRRCLYVERVVLPPSDTFPEWL